MSGLALDQARPSAIARAAARIAGLSRRSPTLAIGAAILLTFALLAVLAPWIAPENPVAANSARVLHAPAPGIWFGTDGNGMDVLSRVIHGSLYAFGIAIPVVIVGLCIGVPVGLWTGWTGGWPDEIVMRGSDALRVFPSIILALAVVAAAGPSLLNVVLVLGLLDAP
ncbi:MAG: ABC transporter permease, partial [Thermaurantiacus sp.]